ncbi:MAG: outer membrane beta-barrel protein [Gemmatimonadaceae bacterium]
MKTTAALAVLSAGAMPLAAQRAIRSAAITPYAGYMLFGDLANGPLGTRLASGNGAVYGAQLGIPFTDNIAIVGNVAHSAPSLQIGAPIIGGYDIGSSSLWMYDAALELSAPLGTATARPIRPFVQLGGGAMHYAVNVKGINSTATNAAFVLGAGVDVPLSAGFALRVQATDYIGKFDFKEATGLGFSGNTTHNLALSAGVKLGF